MHSPDKIDVMQESAQQIECNFVDFTPINQQIWTLRQHLGKMRKLHVLKAECTVKCIFKETRKNASGKEN